MIPIIFFSLWFFLPAGIANMVPVVIAKIPVLSSFTYPLDCFKKYKGKRIFGDHKTIRGIICGVLGSIIVSSLQYQIYLHTFLHTIFSYPWNPIIVGLLLGLGALGGDAIKSFFKRQYNISSGTSWFPFDQCDYIIGAIIATFLYSPVSISIYLIIFALYFLLHLSISYMGYLWGFKRSPL